MTASIRPRDLRTRPDGRTVVEVKRSTYKNKQRSLKAARLEKAWRSLCKASSPKDKT